MAITYGFSEENAKALLLKLGVDKDLLKSVFAFGWSVKLTAVELAFIKDAEKYPVPIDLSTMQKLSEGKLSTAVLAKISEAAKATAATVMSVSAQAAAGVLDDLPPAEPVSAAVPDKGPGLTFTGPAKSPPKSGPAPETGFWPIFNTSKLKTAAPVTLRDAKMMYQPVKGTSQGSRYFVVGGNQDLRIAARLSGATLSVRIEGYGWKKHQAAISQCGFDVYADSKDYASLHLAVGDDLMMAHKTLGAILVGLGVPLETPIPNLALIKEA